MLGWKIEGKEKNVITIRHEDWCSEKNVKFCSCLIGGMTACDSRIGELESKNLELTIKVAELERRLTRKNEKKEN